MNVQGCKIKHDYNEEKNIIFKSEPSGASRDEKCTSEIKLLLEEIHSRLKNAEEKISELEIIVIKLSIMNKQSLFDNMKLSDIHALGV